MNIIMNIMNSNVWFTPMLLHSVVYVVFLPARANLSNKELLYFVFDNKYIFPIIYIFKEFTLLNAYIYIIQNT